jgi:hypothetical protein
MRGVVSKTASNVSLAGESKAMKKPKWALKRKPDTVKADLTSPLVVVPEDRVFIARWNPRA